MEDNTQPTGDPQVTTNGTTRSTYIGTKVVNAYPQTHHEFLAKKGQSTENENMHGYAVIYEDGYTSWSPKAVFERCYRLITDAEKLMM